MKIVFQKFLADKSGATAIRTDCRWHCHRDHYRRAGRGHPNEDQFQHDHDQADAGGLINHHPFLRGANSTPVCAARPRKLGRVFHWPVRAAPKLGHCVIQLRPLGLEIRAVYPAKKEHIANIEQTWYEILIRRRILKPAIARLSRSRIPAIRSTYYVRHCPAYRRRILHG